MDRRQGWQDLNPATYGSGDRYEEVDSLAVPVSGTTAWATQTGGQSMNVHNRPLVRWTGGARVAQPGAEGEDARRAFLRRGALVDDDADHRRRRGDHHGDAVVQVTAGGGARGSLSLFV